MDQLYRLRQQLRQPSTASEQQQLVWQRQVTDLARRLPMAALRHDLEIHFMASLGGGDDDDAGEPLDSNAATTSGLDYYRNFVQDLPPPIPSSCWHQPNGVYHNDCSSGMVLEPADNVVLERVTAALDRLMVVPLQLPKDKGCTEPFQWQLPSDEPRLVGVSVFYRGQICLPTRTIFSNDYSLSNDTAVAILWYLASFQWRGGSGIRPPPPSFALQFTADTTPDDVLHTHHTNGYVPPPPLSVLSALDQIYPFWGPPADRTTTTTTPTLFENATTTSQVWCPPVCLPFELNNRCGKQSRERTPDVQQQLNARVCLYCHGEYSFLLYLSPSSGMEGETTNAVIDSVDSPPPSSSWYYQNLFVTVQTELETALLPDPMAEPGPLKTTTVDTDSEPCQYHSWAMPGLDVIWIDRRRHSVVLFRDPRAHHHETSNTAAPTPSTSSAKNLLGLFGKNHQPSSSTKNNSTTSSACSSSAEPGRSTNFGDCRYHLAASLPREVILALEDAMDEVQPFRVASNSSSCAVDGEEETTATTAFNPRVLELCTLLSSHWVYTWAQGDHELYIALDVALFVTMADVQNAVRDVRLDLLGHDEAQSPTTPPPTE
jgi:hypothetical protein